jgi:opacity protein-like surface antigen
MKRWALFCGVMMLFAGAASAQDISKVEVFGGYSYLRTDTVGVDQNFNGGSGSATYNLKSWLGAVGDFGAYHWAQSGFDANVVTYLFGPRVNYRMGRMTPFGQALLGGAHISGSELTDCEGILRCNTSSQNAFAMAVGGGADWNATSHIGIRLVQAEYFLTKFDDNLHNRQNNGRLSAGVVFRF